ncbi:TPA: hypothetical protein QCI16_005046 [Enterobacter ludwigii]|nr:hypothetical protein [Enterobacter ludwigii]HDR2600794.1 hypothetical protein [Enterobacter ludwigii]
MQKVSKSPLSGESAGKKSGLIRDERQSMSLRLTERQHEALRWLAGYYDMSMSAVARVAILEMRERVVSGLIARGHEPVISAGGGNKYYRVTYSRPGGGCLMTLAEAGTVREAGENARRFLALYGEPDVSRAGLRLEAISRAEFRESWHEAVSALCGTLEHGCALLSLYGDGLEFDDCEALRAAELLIHPQTNEAAFTACRDLLARCVARLAADTRLKLDVEAGQVSPLALAREVYGS